MSRSTIVRLRPGGVVLHYEAEGSGPPVIFQHGLGGDAAQVAEVFPSRPVRRITLECRGQGESAAGPLAELSLRTFCDDVASLAAVLGVARAVVGGLSMGAAIALQLAVRRPDLVSGLVLARPAWLFERMPDNMRPHAWVGELLKRSDRAAARAEFAGSHLARRLAVEAPANLESLLGYFDEPPGGTTAALLAAIAADDPGVSEAEAARIAVPTLVIGHGDDVVHPLALAQRLASVIPNARLVEITSKSSNYQRYVADFRAAVADFLAGTSFP
jgi:pimeloyl-ACP methyl ester carboxylesterase